MNKNLHDRDEFFKSAYQQFEDEPSPAVWEKLNAALDKKEADSDKRRFIIWRRAAIILLVLLVGFILFDAVALKTGRSNDNITRKKSHTPGSRADKNEMNNDSISSVGKGITTQSEKGATENFIVENNLMVNQNDNVNILMSPTAGLKNPENQETTDDNRLRVNEKTSTVTLSDKGNTSKLFMELLNNIRLSAPPITNEFILKISDAKSIKKGKDKFFIPYWVMTAFVSYDRVNYKLDSDFPDNINSIKHREVHEPSFSGGALVTRQLTKHWGLQTGLVYSHTAIGISPQKMYAFRDPAGDVAYKYITSSGYAFIKPGVGTPPSFGDSLTTLEAKHTLKYISVPLLVNYRMEKNKMSVTPGAGIEANFLISAKVETEIENASSSEIVFINKLNGAKSFYWSGVVDAAVQYKVNNNLSVTLQPSFRYALSPITKNNVVETFPYSFGIRAGLVYKF